MTHKITKKIVSFKVINEEEKSAPANDEAAQPALESMHENVARPEVLLGSTYKLKRHNQSMPFI